MSSAAAGRLPSTGRRRLGDIPLLEVGLRPFFLLGAAWAVVALALWLAALDGRIGIGGAYGPLAWHGHEMVYGFATAILAGFLLTAVPNWTGRAGVAGTTLAWLAALWLAGRIAMTGLLPIGTPLVALLDLSFLAMLLALTFRQVIAGRNWRNLPVALAPALLIAGNAMVHLEGLGLASTAALGNRTGIAVFVLLVVLIGGRIIPAFTGNWLRNEGKGAPLPVQPNRFDVSVLVMTAIAMAAWLARPEGVVTASLAAAAGIGQIARLARWQGIRTLGEPLVWMLHLAYAWVPIGLLLASLSAIRPEPVPATSALHALTAGVMASMMVAMMTRAALGHTGRPLTADTTTLLIYLLTTGAAAGRVAASLLPVYFLPLVTAAGLLWAGAFGLYLAAYGPKLCLRRLPAR